MGRLLLFLTVCCLTAACVGPAYRAPSLDAEASRTEREALIRTAMDTALSRRARVYDLAWPVLTANTELCPETRRAIGIVLADRPQLARLSGGLREEELEDIGVEEGLRIQHVHAGSPADRAGVPQGAFITDVEEEALEDDDPSDAGAKMREAGKTGPVTFTIRTEEGTRTFTIEPTEICDMQVKISTSQSINAHVLTGDIVVYTGAIRSLDDASLQYLIAHEAAHLAAGHKREYVWNTVVSGAVIAGPVLYPLAWAGDRVQSMAGRKTDLSLRSRTVRLLAPWTEDFESEADYLGLYMYARAGGALPGARGIFETFGREQPSSIYARVTHPLAPERLARLEATIVEIEAKRRAGVSLLPEKREGQ